MTPAISRTHSGVAPTGLEGRTDQSFISTFKGFIWIFTIENRGNSEEVPNEYRIQEVPVREENEL